jgi:uncharacterized repeat protein (TIGR03847 family)
MARRLFDFDQPERFVAGTVGDPGARTFFLQARQGGAIVSVALEKLQVSALADRLSELLDVIEGSAPEPASAVLDDAPLDEPLVEVFRVGLMALAWDPSSRQVVIEAQPQDLEGEDATAPADDTGEGPDLMRVRIAPAQAHAFVRRAQRLVAAGRPACPFCGEPLEPTGHFCVQSDGLLN